MPSTSESDSELKIEVVELDPGSSDPYALVAVTIITTQRRIGDFVTVLDRGCLWAASGRIGDTVCNIFTTIRKKLRHVRPSYDQPWEASYFERWDPEKQGYVERKRD